MESTFWEFFNVLHLFKIWERWIGSAFLKWFISMTVSSVLVESALSTKDNAFFSLGFYVYFSSLIYMGIVVIFPHKNEISMKTHTFLLISSFPLYINPV